jgi:hypothetical protein
MMIETKTRRATSYTVMRSLLTFTVAVLLLGLPGISSAFSCPRMTPASVQTEPCSHCPTNKQQKSCPISACILICPYTVEKTSDLASDAPTNALIPPVQPSTLVLPSFPDAHAFSAALTREADSGPLYLFNRVLLI